MRATEFLIAILALGLFAVFVWLAINFFSFGGERSPQETGSTTTSRGSGTSTYVSPSQSTISNPTTPAIDNTENQNTAQPVLRRGGGSISLPDLSLSPDNLTPVEINKNAINFVNREVEIFARQYDPSPYQGQIQFLERTSSLEKDDPADEYVTLVVTGASVPISVTDWQIFSFFKKEAHTFPYGIELLVPNEPSQIAPISVKQGDHIIVSSGFSPVSASFRTNKCIGYRQQFKDFTPSLKERCPDPQEELETYGRNISFTDVICLDFVDGVDTCEAPTNLPDDITRKCYDFVTDILTEGGCVDNHKIDRDFYGNELRVYLSSVRELWREEGDAIFLIDAERRLVDVFEY